MPAPSDLTDWWVTVELALCAIHETVRPDRLGDRAIRMLAPLILGPAGYQLVA